MPDLTAFFDISRAFGNQPAINDLPTLVSPTAIPFAAYLLTARMAPQIASRSHLSTKVQSNLGLGQPIFLQGGNLKAFPSAEVVIDHMLLRLSAQEYRKIITPQPPPQVTGSCVAQLNLRNIRIKQTYLCKSALRSPPQSCLSRTISQYPLVFKNDADQGEAHDSNRCAHISCSGEDVVDEGKGRTVLVQKVYCCMSVQYAAAKALTFSRRPCKSIRRCSRRLAGLQPP